MNFPFSLTETSESIARSSGSNFLTAFSVLSKERKEALTAVYAFARRVDDCVDEIDDSEEKRNLLKHYQAEIDHCYTGKQSSEVFMQELAQAINRFSIPRQPFDDLIRGCEMDIEPCVYQTIDELLQYCYCVASSVGLMCLPIFGCSHPQSREYAINLGYALQLTNIIRDIASDAERDRIYLPREELDRFQYSPDELKKRVYNEQFQSLMAFQVNRAMEYYLKAAQCLPAEDRRCLLAARIMGRIYRGILEKIKRNRYQVFGPKIRLGKIHKSALALQTCLGLDGV